MLYARFRERGVGGIPPHVDGLREGEVRHGVGGHVLLVVGHGLADEAMRLRQEAGRARSGKAGERRGT